VDEPEFDVFRVLEKLADPKLKIPFDENATFTCDPEALREFNERVWYHPRRRRVLVGVKRASSIIHAEGVRGWYSIIRAKGAHGGLPIAGDSFELAAYVLEVIRAYTQADHFLDHGKEISQRANRAQRRGIGGAHQSSRCRQHECVFDFEPRAAAAGGRRRETPV
jgi:hypothetical protein